MKMNEKQVIILLNVTYIRKHIILHKDEHIIESERWAVSMKSEWIKKREGIIDCVIQYFEQIREQYPNVTNEMLADNGSIKYMNGDNGTDFDWDMNGRLSKFCILYKSGLEFIKVLIRNTDLMEGYVYEDNIDSEADRIKKEELSEGDAVYLASLLLQEADDKNLYDKNIDAIDFDAEVSSLLPTDVEIIMEEDYLEVEREEEDYDDDYDGDY